MKTIKSLLLTVVILTVGGIISCTESQSSGVFVNPDVVIVKEFEGWGTSLAWWADVLGGMNEEVIDSVTTALFSPDKLNLNIVRYTIGGTTPYNHTCGPYRNGAATESFQDGPNLDYNWTRDPRQRYILSKAKNLGVDTFEAFSNTPPQWMTISGCSKGNPLGGLLHANLNADMSDAFAEYATTVIKHFHDVLEITFQTYAPFNEPFGLGGLGGWFGELSSQEGCNIARPVMAAVIKSLDVALKSKAMDYVTVTTADETQIQTGTATQNYFRDNGVSHLYTKVNTHGYWDVVGNRRDLLSMASHRDGHKLWMSEMGWEETPLNDMTQGLAIANRILVDLKKLLPSAWVYWQAVEGYGQWGLISIPYDRQNVSLADIEYNSGYYSMMQFSKYIRKGYHILSVNEDNTLAAYNGNNLVLVIVNNDKQQTIRGSYNLNLFKSFGNISTTRTSPSEQNINIQISNIEDKKLIYDAPPHSITTIVISETIHISSGNLLQNGDFEILGAWSLDQGTIGGINTENVWRGKSSGYIASSETSQVRLIQIVDAPKTGIYYLSAWCSTSSSGAKLGVLKNGMGLSELSIVKGVGYETYGLSFNADINDKITVYFYSVQENAISYIDDASLYYSYN